MSGIHATGRPRTGIVATVFFGVSYFVLIARGLLQERFSQETAYGIQFFVLITLLLVALWASKEGSFTVYRLRLKSRRTASKFLFVWLVFMLTVGISSLITVFSQSFSHFWLYAGISVFYATFILVFATTYSDWWLRIHLGVVFGSALSLLLAVGLWEQRTGADLAGAGRFSDFVRPASLTGSKQHYALVMALLAVVFLEMYMQSKRRVYLAIGMIGIGGSVLSLTRGGPTILLIAGLFALPRLALKAWGGRRLIMLVILISLMAVGLAGLEGGLFLERVTSAIDPDSPGNAARIDAWERAFTLWRDGPLLFGDRVGMVTQSTGKFFEETGSFHVESGVLQQLLNYGLFGAAAFYGLLFLLVRALHPRHYWLRGGIIGAIVQSFTYMSIEVIPFMATVALFPIASSWISARLSVEPRSRPHAELRATDFVENPSFPSATAALAPTEHVLSRQP